MKNLKILPNCAALQYIKNFFNHLGSTLFELNNSYKKLENTYLGETKTTD